MTSGVGRAVVVTGASGGIGAAIARIFAAGGDRVAVHYRTGRDRAEAVLTSMSGDGHMLAQADLTDPDAIFAMIDEVAQTFGRIRHLVGAANVTWCAARHMGRGGRIVNVASRGAFRGEPRQPDDVAAAVNGASHLRL